MGVWVGQRSKTVIIFLTCRIPKGEFNMFTINLDIGHVVFEDSGDIDLSRSSSALLTLSAACCCDHSSL
jgi:hypothetical protein